MDAQRAHPAIGLKRFYASVECVDRGLDPLTTGLVVADAPRTEIPPVGEYRTLRLAGEV